ncbi:MAG TPA: diaminopimelate decarboxylase [Gammaproteobacteria bacterium]|nr:diaminopimelate decarboxylase [Gammaproteobacteria bacterium]
MDHFQYRDGRLFAEQVDLARIAARWGTPAYIYSRATLERHWRAFDRALEGHDHLICYAVKANSNLAILNLLARLGSGFDVVSVGELERVLQAGGDPARVVFSGVGKRADEIRRALRVGIHCFNVESEAELLRIQEEARQTGSVAPVSLRVNPDVDPNTHPYISTGLKENKFGIGIERAPELYRRAATLGNIRILGVACHIGSQLTDTTPFLDALQRILELVDRLEQEGITLRHLNLGGGLGITYHDETPPLPDQYAAAVLDAMGGRKLRLILEPGRAIAGNAGILLTRVEYLKHTGHRNFAILDAAMNDLMRPALYQAWHTVVPVRPRRGSPVRYDLVGPVCETGDLLGRDRDLVLEQGDLLAIRSAGAYGFTMSSNYNSRPRPAELLVDGDQIHEIRSREEIADLFRGERMLP